jgi:hypothetical protein
MTARLLATLGLLACMGCSSNQGDDSNLMVDTKHEHYHVHGANITHKHTHQDFASGAHVHPHEHAKAVARPNTEMEQTDDSP